ncbi:MAG TPA: transposase [Deltaproteobacteria bacterium]|nr:transposase [Deltaproteobacteria bacterium]
MGGPCPLCGRIEPLPPVYEPPVGGGRPRADDKEALRGILFTLKAGTQWTVMTEAEGLLLVVLLSGVTSGSGSGRPGRGVGPWGQSASSPGATG